MIKIRWGKDVWVNVWHIWYSENTILNDYLAFNNTGSAHNAVKKQSNNDWEWDY